MEANCVNFHSEKVILISHMLSESSLLWMLLYARSDAMFNTMEMVIIKTSAKYFFLQFTNRIYNLTKYGHHNLIVQAKIFFNIVLHLTFS